MLGHLYIDGKYVGRCTFNGSLANLPDNAALRNGIVPVPDNELLPDYVVCTVIEQVRNYYSPPITDHERDTVHKMTAGQAVSYLARREEQCRIRQKDPIAVSVEVRPIKSPIAGSVHVVDKTVPRSPESSEIIVSFVWSEWLDSPMLIATQHRKDTPKKLRIDLI